MRSSRGSTISPRVLLAVDKGVAVEPVGDFALKGMRRPMAAYNVLAAASPKNRTDVRFWQIVLQKSLNAER
jgi:hypothetical protein